MTASAVQDGGSCSECGTARQGCRKTLCPTRDAQARRLFPEAFDPEHPQYEEANRSLDVWRADIW